MNRGELLVLGKYLLFQVPSWLVVGALAWGARGWFGLPDWTLWLALALLVTKDAVLFPYVRQAYSLEARKAAHHLEGRRGLVERHDSRETWVRVGPELWRARCDEPLEPGARVRVEDVVGHTLVVSPWREGR